MPRREKGSGSLSERPAGSGRFWLRVYLGRDPVTGKPRQANRTVTARNLTDARKQLSAFIAEVTAEDGAIGTESTVGTVVEEWIRHSESRARSPRTIHEARRTLETVIGPAIGDVPVKDLTARHLDELYRQLRMGEGPTGRKLSPATVRRYHAVISAALTQAVKWGWLDRNPAERAQPPEADKRSQRIPTAEEVRVLVIAAQARKPEWGVLVKLALLTGARRGELCALRWTDVGPESILFARSLYRAGEERGEKSTKSGRERIVTLDPVGVAVLEDWRLRCEARAGEADVELVEDAFVVSTMPDGSRPFNPDSFSSTVHKLCAVLGMPHVHLHSLRHFAATMALQSGVDARNVAELLGHADGGVLVLGTYAHATTAVQRQAAAALGQVLVVPDE